MGCIYENMGFGGDAGLCQLWEQGCEMPGTDENGICCVSDDPDPGYTCESYESDYTCSECGADLNVEECDCDND